MEGMSILMQMIKRVKGYITVLYLTIFPVTGISKPKNSSMDNANIIAAKKSAN
jgi:hypothetical protein